MSAGSICPRAQYFRGPNISAGPIFPRAQYFRGPNISAANMSAGPLCPPAHYARGPNMSGPICPLDPLCLAFSQGACGNAWKIDRACDCEWRNHNRLYQFVLSLRSSVIESFIFLLESRWTFLMKELLICGQFSVNDGQSQVPSFDLNNDVFDLKLWPLIAK